MNSVNLIDIIPLDHLQSLQDKFSVANGVASIILDLDGKPVTQPGNINEVCNTMFNEGAECLQNHRLVNGTVETNRSCKLFEAKSPIYIDGRHIADWKIGMCGFGEIIAPFMRAACDTPEKFEEMYVRLYDKIQGHFQSVCDLLQVMAAEISEVGYTNIRLERELKKQEETQAELVNSAITFHSIFDNSVDGISLIGNDKIVKEWSLGYEKLTGIPKDKAVGKNISELFDKMLSRDHYTEDEIIQLQDRLNFVISKKEQVNITRHIINQKTQQARIINTLYFPVYLPEGTMLGAIARDITENVAKEHELFAEKERLETLGNNLPDVGLYQFAANPQTGEQKYTYISKSWETIIGIPADIALKDINKVISQVHPDDVSILLQKVEHCVRTLDNFYDEYRVLVNGSYRWIRMSSRMHREDDWVVADGVIIDINNQKEAEKLLKENTRKLTAEKERLQALGDNYPDGCLYQAIMDINKKELKFTYLSKPWEIMSGGVSIETAINNIHEVYDLIVPEDLPVLMDAIMKSAETLTKMKIDVRFQLSEQNIKWAQVSSAPHLENHFVVWDGYILDITERKDSDLKLESYRNYLELAVREQTEALQAAN